MTVRLYYDNSYMREFSGTIVEQRILKDRIAVVLDQTGFYPTSGGQPHDKGTLGHAQVLEVEEDESGAILHILDKPVPPGRVAGKIDWDLRFDHMQQHTGQHILSQAFIRVAQAATVGFHLSKDTATIDVELSQPSPSVMEAAESLATQVVFEDRPVNILTVNREGMAALGVRKESAREGEIRIIDIENFDRSPCGGTHVRHTGEVGMIAVLGFERYKGGTRVEFACGGRALRTLRADHGLLKELGRLYSSHPSDLQRLSEKLIQERSTLARENARYREQILDFEAQDLVNHGERISGTVVVKAHFPGRSLESLKVLAQKVALRPGAIAILAAGDDEALLVAARHPGTAGDCGAAIRQTAAKFGGKGGGKPELAQAGGISAGNLEAWFRELTAYFAHANQDHPSAPQG